MSGDAVSPIDSSRVCKSRPPAASCFGAISSAWAEAATHHSLSVGPGGVQYNYTDMASIEKKACSPAAEGAVTVSVRAYSESEHAKHSFAPRDAYRRLTSFFPRQQPSSAKGEDRRNRSCFFGRSQAPPADEKRGVERSSGIEAVTPASPSYSKQMDSPQSSAGSSCSTSSAARLSDLSPEVQSCSITAEENRCAEPGFTTPPRRGRIHHAGHRRDKSLRTVGGELIDGDPERDLQLVIDETGEVPPVLTAVSGLLECLLDHSQDSWEKMLPDASKGPDSATSATVFYGKCIPPISLHDYVVRIHKYGHCSPAAFLYAIVYMDRLVDKYGSCMAPNRFNVHRLLLTGVIAGAKFLDDRVFSNAYYGRVGGVATSEMNRMEKELLHLLDFRLVVPNESLEAYCKALQSSHLTAAVAEKLSSQQTCAAPPAALAETASSAVTAA